MLNDKSTHFQPWLSTVESMADAPRRGDPAWEIGNEQLELLHTTVSLAVIVVSAYALTVGFCSLSIFTVTSGKKEQCWNLRVLGGQTQWMNNRDEAGSVGKD